MFYTGVEISRNRGTRTFRHTAGMQATAQRQRTRGWGRTAALASVLSAGAAVAAILLMEFLKDRWGGLECGDTNTRTLEWLQLASLVLAAVAVVAGLLGLFAAGARRKVYALTGIIVAVCVVALIWEVPLNGAEGPLGDFGRINCGITVA
jgi:hypothetical protein